VNSPDIKDPTNSPFMVAVSGHRDLAPQDTPRLREAVTTFVQQLQTYLPDTELRLIVGMAEGADLLVAETALALGVAVEAVLPMPLEHYAADFDAVTLAHLQTLLAHPQVRRVELAALLPTPASAAPHTAAQRDAMFAHLAATLIRRSSLLLALWDGEASSRPGGTADTVLRYLNIRSENSTQPEHIEFVTSQDEPDIVPRLVYWMPAARHSTGVTDQRPPCFLFGAGENLLQVVPEMPGWLKDQLEHLNEYNAEFRRLTASGSLHWHNSLMEAVPEDMPPAVRDMLAEMDTQYSKADALAVHYQRRSERLFDVFGVMAFFMGLAYLMYEKLTESRMLLIAYAIILLASLTVYYLLQGRRWFGKHLTYRALAETLRARFYLRLAGGDRRVDALEVLTLSGIDRFEGFGLIGLVMKGIEPADLETSAERLPTAAQGVERSWIESQHAYFTRKVARLQVSMRRVKRLRYTLFVGILLVISLLFVFGDSLHHIDMGLGVPVKNVLTFTMGALAVLLGVWELHQNKLATRELLWQYRNQLGHFARARIQLARATSARRRHDVLVALGKDSLMESYLWAIHRYHREHEPPATGGAS
jgi:hypothetical protein